MGQLALASDLGRLDLPPRREASLATLSQVHRCPGSSRQLLSQPCQCAMQIRFDGAQPAIKEPCNLCFREVLVVTENNDGALTERKPTDSSPGPVELGVFNQAWGSRRLAPLHSKMAKVAAAEVDHGRPEIGRGIVYGSPRSGDTNKGLLNQFLCVCCGTDKQQCHPNHPVPLRTIQSLQFLSGDSAEDFGRRRPDDVAGDAHTLYDAQPRRKVARVSVRRAPGVSRTSRRG